MAPPAKAPHARRSVRTTEDADLLVTIDERHRARAEAEILDLLGRAHIDGTLVEPPADGLVGVHVPIEARACIPRLRAILSEDPFAFQHTHRWIPMEGWIRANANELRAFAAQIGHRISPDESWAIDVDRRNARARREDIVQAAAEGIANGHVSLTSPDKTLFIEVCGDRAGLAVLEPHDLLSVDRTLREEFVLFEEVR